MKKLHRLILFVIFCFAFPFVTLAFETATHKQINEYIATNTLNSFSLDSYLKTQLGFTNGVEEKFTSDKTKKVWEWVQLGGYYEDIPKWYLPYIRSLNHFHNPITEEGFKGDCLGSSLCVSSTVWALMPLGTQSSTTGNYSWLDARDYYYKALISSTKTERDTNFAETFRGLGQLMHLVQDASVPEHVRNDTHILGDGYEKWVRNNHGSLNLSPTTYDSSILNETPNSLAPIPIAKIFDTDKYTGANPSTSLSWGIAEYTNSNFASDETIFTENYDQNHKHYFPYPNKSSTDLQDYINGNKLPETVTGEDNIPDITFYIKKERDGEVIERFVKPGYMNQGGGFC